MYARFVLHYEIDTPPIKEILIKIFGNFNAAISVLEEMVDDYLPLRLLNQKNCSFDFRMTGKKLIYTLYY